MFYLTDYQFLRFQSFPLIFSLIYQAFIPAITQDPNKKLLGIHGPKAAYDRLPSAKCPNNRLWLVQHQHLSAYPLGRLYAQVVIAIGQVSQFHIQLENPLPADPGFLDE
ncbi:MAG: hypothetical protein AAFW73_10435 [Bacteroidota bacterium]